MLIRLQQSKPFLFLLGFVGWLVIWIPSWSFAIEDRKFYIIYLCPIAAPLISLIIIVLLVWKRLRWTALGYVAAAVMNIFFVIFIAMSKKSSLSIFEFLIPFTVYSPSNPICECTPLTIETLEAAPLGEQICFAGSYSGKPEDELLYLSPRKRVLYKFGSDRGDESYLDHVDVSGILTKENHSWMLTFDKRQNCHP